MDYYITQSISIVYTFCYYRVLLDDIIELAGRRPVTARDISGSLNVNINEVIKNLKNLIDRGKLKYRVYNNKKYYYI